MKKFTYLIIISLILSNAVNAQKSLVNIKYAEVDGRQLLLDVYLPQGVDNPYLVVWVHGGAWHSGSKEDPPKGLLTEGFALASIDYRLSVEAPFPAMIHDIKAAIRFLRANASDYGYRSDKIVIWGSSAGGHLVALVGTTNGSEYHEGSLGDFLNVSSNVQATIDFYGPANFMTILDQSTPHGVNVRAPALALLLGRPVQQAEGLAKLASPVYQAGENDPPIFIAHGDQDYQVPVNQALELKSVFEKNNNEAVLEIVSGAGHGSPDYYQPEFIQKVTNFLDEVLKE